MKKCSYSWRNIWTVEEENLLRERYYLEGPSEEICSILKRKKAAVTKKANLLGLVTKKKLDSKPWTEEQEKILIERYPKEGPTIQLQKEINKTAHGLHIKASKLGLKWIRWTEEQLCLLRTHYSHEGASDHLCRLLGKEKGTVFSMAKKLDIQFENYPKFWTPEEEALLIKEYPSKGSSKSLQFLFKRNGEQIRVKANKMGLKLLKRVPNRTGCGEVSGQYLAVIRKGARDRSLEYSLTSEYVWDLFLKQNRRCALSGVELKFPASYSKRAPDQTASLDRIDSSRGYIAGNVQWVHKFINQMKGFYPQCQFIKYCKLVAKNMENYIIDDCIEVSKKIDLGSGRIFEKLD